MTTTSESGLKPPSLATIARYFRIGLELGICEPDATRAWAISVIDAMDEPPGEIIEVSWRKPLAQLIDDLNAVDGEFDLHVLRGWSLHKLWQSMQSPDAQFESVAR